MKKNKLLIIFSIIILFTFFSAVNLPFIEKIYPNIYVRETYIGNKSKDEAIDELQIKIRIPEKIVFIAGDKPFEVFSTEIVNSIDYKKTVDRAYNMTNSSNILDDTINKIDLIFNPVRISPQFILNEDKLVETLSIISNTIGQKTIQPSAQIINGQIMIDPGKDGVEVDTVKTKNTLLEELAKNGDPQIKVDLINTSTKLTTDEVKIFTLKAEKLLGKTLEFDSTYEKFTFTDNQIVNLITPLSFNETEIKKEILSISRKLNRNPQDSVFIVENGIVKEFIPSLDGITVDESVLIESITKSINQLINSDIKSLAIAVPVVKVSPKIKNEDVNDLGIKSLLGIGRSNFKGSIPNRIHNVNLAQSKFKGLLVAPNETVSFNDVLGDVSSFTGYKAAYVILDGKTVLGDGGGVCQVSTTLFRAVLNAGLPVVERRAHAYRVGYYEQGFGPGLDATVYSPTTDFKFKNDTSAHILIQTAINLEDLSLVFEIYGTDDGRISTTTKPVITSQTAPAEDLYLDDPTLKVGQIKQIEHSAYGAKVSFDYHVERNGQILIDQKFTSNYRSWRNVYLKGTAL